MIELEAHVQQQTTLEDAGCDDPRITDGAQQNCVVLTNLVQLVRREQLAGGVVATGTEIVFGGFQIRNQLAEHLERLGSDLDADSVTRNDRKLHGVLISVELCALSTAGG